MRNGKSVLSMSVLFALALASATAQNAATPGGNPPAATPAPAREKPAPQDLDPAVNTSATARTPQDPEPSVDTSATLPAHRSAAPGPRAAPAGAAAADAPAAAKGATPDSSRSQQGAPRTRSGKAQDRLELDTTQITGNRELPKVLYIVPWKRSDLSDLTGRPVNSLLDEVLTPVDRDVFRRENRYYRALMPDGGAVPAPGAGAPADKPAAAGATAEPATRDER